MIIKYSATYPLLIEFGSYFTHVGQSGNDEPTKSFRTPNTNIEDKFKYIFYEILKIDPSEFKVVLVKDTFTPKIVLKEEADLLFNKFNVKAVSFVNAQVGIYLSWISKGSEALIVDIGYSSTKIVSIINGMVQTDFSFKIDFSEKDIENYIIKDLIQNGINSEIIENNKEELIPYLIKKI